MKNCNIRFERDPSLDHIEVVIRAPERDETVAELMEKLADKPPDKLMVFNASGIKQAITTREIIFASADGKLVNLVTKDGREIRTKRWTSGGSCVSRALKSSTWIMWCDMISPSPARCASSFRAAWKPGRRAGAFRRYAAS